MQEQGANGIKRTFVKGKMNKDIDERLLPKGEYLDALNLITSDEGVARSINGNVRLSNLGLVNAKTIGVYVDTFRELIYWFVTSETKDLVLEYNYPVQKLEVVLESSKPDSVLGFDRDFLITGINKIYNEDSSKDLLCWTDNNVSPKKANISRAKTYGADNFSLEDISVILKPPIFAPKINLSYTSSKQENNIVERYLHFAYRYRYIDGEHSALSQFSNVAFSPKEFDLDYQTLENIGMVNAFNAVVLKFFTGGKNVTDIQLVFKEVNNTTIYLVETFNKERLGYADNSEYSFKFSNNKIYSVLPESELFRMFDNVPRLAKAQEVIGNRLVYGNYLENFDVVDAFGNEDLNYTLSLNTKSLLGVPLSSSVATNTRRLKFNIEPSKLKSGAKITFDFDMSSSDNRGTYNGGNEYILNRDFNSLDSLIADEDFKIFIEEVLTDNFIAFYNYNEEDDVDFQSTEKFKAYKTASNEITIEAPVVTYRRDLTPSDQSDDDDPNTYQDFDVEWNFTNESGVLYEEIAVNSSLKTERSYEIGFIYKEDFGRATTILTVPNNTIFIPQQYSTSQNKIVVNINHRPPTFAKYYALAIKQNKLIYETIYATVFYEDGLFRWVKLEGGNKDKVKEGDVLVVKADLNGAVNQPIEVKVLEIQTKESNFITGNLDDDGSEIVEQAGLYMKIKPSGFNMNYNDTTFLKFDEFQEAGDNSDKQYLKSLWQSYIYSSPTAAGLFTPNLAYYLAVGGTTDPVSTDGLIANNVSMPILAAGSFSVVNEISGDVVDLKIPAGSQIRFYFRSWKDKNNDVEKVFDVKKTATNDYDTIADFWNAEIRTLGDKDLDFNIDFARNKANNQLYLIVQGEKEGKNIGKNAKLNVIVELNLSGGLIIFETKPKDVDSNIFYETSQTFEIQNGNHLGNIQDQDSLNPAIVELDAFNCFVHGNGAESIKIKDALLSNHLNFDTRPSAVNPEGYKAIRRLADLTYSEPYNESSGLNGLNNFNLSKANFKDDIDIKYGGIKKLVSRDTDLVVFQEDKIHKVRFFKEELYNADDTANLSTTNNVLGNHVPYAGEFGISNNPESVAIFGNSIFFTDAKRGYVLRLSLDGISIISDFGMHNYFKDLFKASLNMKKVGAFDPYYDLYTLGSEGVSVAKNNKVVSCSDVFFKEDVTGVLEFEIDFGLGTGECGFNFDVNGDGATVEVVWNNTSFGVVQANSEGQYRFNKTSPLPQKAKVILRVAEDKCVNTLINTVCPSGDELTVVSLAVNDNSDISQSILNRYRWSYGGYASQYKNYQTTFNEDNPNFYDVKTGVEGIGVVPKKNSQIYLESVKGFNDTGVFEQGDRLGYFYSNSLLPESSYQQIIDNATWVNTSVQNFTNGDIINRGDFTFNPLNNEKYLYLIWDYVRKNNPPIAVDDFFNCNRGQTISFNVLSNDSDIDNDTLSIQITRPPSFGSVVINSDNTITYTHNGSDNFDDVIVYRVFDGQLYSNEASVFLSIGLPCSEGLNATGTDGIYEIVISLGRETGIAGIDYNAVSVPDRFIIEYDGQIVADSKFVGDGLSGVPPTYTGLSGTKTLPVFEYDGSQFNDTNTTRDITVTQNDIANGNDEPTAGAGQLRFNKTSELPQQMKVTIIGFDGGTSWSIQGVCPNT